MATNARRISALAGAVLCFALVPCAHAQVFYSYPGARPVTDTSPSLGLVSGFGDNVVRLGGFGRFNLTSVADLGLEVMFENVEIEDTTDDTGYWGAAADGKYLLISADEGNTLDVAAQVGAGIMTRDDYLLVHVPFGAVASHDFVMNDGRRIVPYGGVYFLFDYLDVNAPAGSPPDYDESSTDFDVEMRIGASAEIVKRGSLFAALHAGNGTMFFLGFNAGL
jgi:hypothetical protein